MILIDDYYYWKIFKSYWDVRRPISTMKDIELVENILTDPDFIEEII